MPLLSSSSTCEFSYLVLTVTTGGASTQHVFLQHGPVSASSCPSAQVAAGRASDVDLRQQTRLGDIVSSGWPAPSRRAPRLRPAYDLSARASVRSLCSIDHLHSQSLKRSEELRHQHTPHTARRTGHARVYIRRSTCEVRISSSRRTRIRTPTRLRLLP